MADTAVATGDLIAVEKFQDLTFREALDLLRLHNWMGTSPEDVIQVNEDV